MIQTTYLGWPFHLLKMNGKSDMSYSLNSVRPLVNLMISTSLAIAKGPRVLAI